MSTTNEEQNVDKCQKYIDDPDAHYEFLKNEFGDIPSDYKTKVIYDLCYNIYVLYVKLLPSHPYLTSNVDYIEKNFDFDDNKFSKRDPLLAKCLFCKYIDMEGTKEEALAHIKLFSSALKKFELDAQTQTLTMNV